MIDGVVAGVKTREGLIGARISIRKVAAYARLLKKLSLPVLALSELIQNFARHSTQEATAKIRRLIRNLQDNIRSTC